MEDMLAKFGTVYGPLGLGWLAFAYVMRLYIALQDKVMNAFLADVELKTSLKASVDNLTDIIKDSKGR